MFSIFFITQVPLYNRCTRSILSMETIQCKSKCNTKVIMQLSIPTLMMNESWNSAIRTPINLHLRDELYLNRSTNIFHASRIEDTTTPLSLPPLIGHVNQLAWHRVATSNDLVTLYVTFSLSLPGWLKESTCTPVKCSNTDCLACLIETIRISNKNLLSGQFFPPEIFPA